MNDAVRAKQIADLLAGCPSEYRADLLLMVGHELEELGQLASAEAMYEASCVVRRSWFDVGCLVKGQV